ncbi:MAG: DUF3846 domain-containing protein [Eubacteriales bacterium]
MSKEFNEKEQLIIQACQSNHWLSDWAEYPAYDYDYGFREVESLEELKEVFLEGNWSIRSGVIFGDLAFVQQVNGGDEWLTMKQEEGRYKVFESISFQVTFQNRGEQGFMDYLKKLQGETVDQYWGREPEPVQEQSQVQDPMDKYCECVEVSEKIYGCDYYADQNLTAEDFVVTEVESREGLQKFFQETQGTLGTMALHGDLLFLKEEAEQDKWLALTKEEGQFQSAYSYPMKELAETVESFDAVMDEIQQLSHEMCQDDDQPRQAGETQTEETPTISVLKVEVGKEPYVKEIGNDLRSLQKEVGGLIQVVLLEDDMEGPQMVVNEEGKINGMAMNRRMPHDIVCGDFFICQSDEEGEFISLTPEKVQEYTEMFQEIPEFSDHEPDAEPRVTIMGFNF